MASLSGLFASSALFVSPLIFLRLDLLSLSSIKLTPDTGTGQLTMHSALNRAQAVFGFFTTVALFVAGVAALSVLLYPADDAKAQVALKDVKVYVMT